MNITAIPGIARSLAALLCVAALSSPVSGAEGDLVDDALRAAYRASQAGDNGRALGLYMSALTMLDEQSLYRIPTVMGEMLTLAQTYPAARTYLEERREPLEMQVLSETPGNALIWEWVALSEGLDGNTQRILRVYDTVHDRAHAPQIANFVWQDLARLERYQEIETVLVVRSQQWVADTGALVVELKKQGPDHEAYVELAPLFVEAGDLLVRGLAAVGRDQELRDVRRLVSELDILTD
ncbi:MAG: hypothetical protein V3U43_06310 [Pseudomonadales bacterium]